MPTLRDLIQLTGVTSIHGRRFGEPERIPSLRSARNMLPLLSDQDRISMRRMMTAIKQLPPISLDASIVGPSQGNSPFTVQVRVEPSAGAVIATFANFLRDGQAFTLGGQPGDLIAGTEFRAAVQSFKISTVGTYRMFVRRIGITKIGLTAPAEKELTFTVTGTGSGPGPAPAPTAPPTRPSIEVDLKGSVSAAVFTVTGSGFLPNLQNTQNSRVVIRVVDGNTGAERPSMTTSSDATGAVDFESPPLDLSDLSLDSTGIARISFSAHDGRIDPASTPAGNFLFSNTVTMTT